MAYIERRLAKLEAELNTLQGKTHYVFVYEDDTHEKPQNFQDGDDIIFIKWEADEQTPGKE